MSIPNAKCDVCYRDHYTAQGERFELEVCKDANTGQMVCLRCYLEQPKQELLV